jgi:hypothetical protein
MLRTRYPTKEEAQTVGREFPNGDEVLIAAGDESDRAALADVLEPNGMCDAAHVIPGGIYLEE